MASRFFRLTAVVLGTFIIGCDSGTTSSPPATPADSSAAAPAPSQPKPRGGAKTPIQGGENMPSTKTVD